MGFAAAKFRGGRRPLVSVVLVRRCETGRLAGTACPAVGIVAGADSIAVAAVQYTVKIGFATVSAVAVAVGIASGASARASSAGASAITATHLSAAAAVRRVAKQADFAAIDIIAVAVGISGLAGAVAADARGAGAVSGTDIAAAATVRRIGVKIHNLAGASVFLGTGQSGKDFSPIAAVGANLACGKKNNEHGR